MSMESAAFYTAQADPEFMSAFDLHMTYRLNSQVVMAYEPFDIRSSPEEELPKWEGREAAVMYMNSNCAPKNKREEIMKALLDRGVAIHAMGACMNNIKEPEVAKQAEPAKHPHRSYAKRKIMEGYRVCVAIENSNVEDYFTEKAWDALSTGCVPLYLGAPNAKADFMPDNSSAIFVEEYASMDELAEEVKRVLVDADAWEARTAWRRRPFDQLNPGYQRLVRGMIDELPHTRCQVCQILADRKLLRMSPPAPPPPPAAAAAVAKQ